MNNPKLKNNKKVKSISKLGVEDIIEQSNEDPQFVFNYHPFRDNDVLVTESTNNEIFVLLKNGSVIKINIEAAIRNQKLETNNEYISNIFLPYKLINISCGSDHILAKGINNKLYSWGSNIYGQLGINSSAQFIKSPEVIKFFDSINDLIDSITARKYSSFITTDRKEIYAWGLMEYLNITREKDEDTKEKNKSLKKYIKPELVNISLNDIKDLCIYITKNVNKLYIANAIRPKKNLHEYVEMQKNKQAILKEFELKDQLERMKMELEQLKKNERSEDDKLDDAEILIRYLNNLKKTFFEKINFYETKNNQKSINTDSYLLQFRAQTKFLENIKNEFKNIDILNTIEDKRLKKIEEIPEEDKKEIIKSNNQDIYEKLFLTDFIDRVTSELQFQKHDVINKDLKLNEQIKFTDRKKKKYQEYINICDNVLKLCDDILTRKYERDAKKEYENTVRIVEKELNNFNFNKLKNLDKTINNPESIYKILDKSMENLLVSEQKISNIIVNKKNHQGLKIKQMIEENITYAKQNNNLMNKILMFQEKYHYNLLDKIIRCDNPSEFITVKNKIDKFKISEYNNFNRERENLYFTQSDLDASYNY